MQVLGFLLILAIILMVRLFMLTGMQHGKWAQISDDMAERSIYVEAPRGEIFDRYGRLLAGNKQSFSVRISGSGLTKEELNSNIQTLLEILDKNGDTFEDNFPIVIEDGEYRFTYQEDIDEWLTGMGFDTGMTAEEAFNAMRSLFNVDPSLDRYDAQKVLQNTYNQYPPISVSDMEYTQDVQRRNFIQRYFGDDEDALEMSAEEAFHAIRDTMKIDESLSDEEARRIMVIRDAVASSGYSQYMPVIVAKNVSQASVMLIEERKDELEGIEVISETTRYYPNGSAASHILGYVGPISEEEAATKSGYHADAIIGQSGIEGSMEDYLKGENGERTVQVNAQGELVQTLSETDVKKGQDIYLTIDLDLQKAAEEGLEKTLKAIQTSGTVQSEYGNTTISKMSPNAKTGAVVCVDVNTHEILAMASYPDYDPNLFSEGISQKDWDSLQSTNLRDPLAPAPLYNLATMATVQPGSTFKPVTATAALEKGLDPDWLLKDNGAIETAGHTFACVAWNTNRTNHGNLNLYTALEVSCNYYFYDISTGYDWAQEQSLGYDIDYTDITHYAEEYGLGKPTGVEISEAVIPVPSEARRLESLQTNLSYVLYANAESYFEPNIYKNPEQLDRSIEKMKGWLAEDKLTWNKLYDDYMPDVGVKDSARQKVGEMILYDYYPQATWSTGDTFNLSIGQGENAYTPLQMANYIATLGNDGIYNPVTLIHSIEDQGLNERGEGQRIDISDESYIDDIMRGMKLVGSGEDSSVSKIFDGLSIDVAAKTGTAERSGKINPPSEVEYIKSHLGEIAPDLSWDEVETETSRLMEEYPSTYSSRDTAVRRAVINLSGVSEAVIDQYKSDYENFAWVVALAPADDPQIAVVAMVPQGATAANAAPIVKEVIGAWLQQSKDYQDLIIRNVVE